MAITYEKNLSDIEEKILRDYSDNPRKLLDNAVDEVIEKARKLLIQRWVKFKRKNGDTSMLVSESGFIEDALNDSRYKDKSNRQPGD